MQHYLIRHVAGEKKSSRSLACSRKSPDYWGGNHFSHQQHPDLGCWYIKPFQFISNPSLTPSGPTPHFLEISQTWFFKFHPSSTQPIPLITLHPNRPSEFDNNRHFILEVSSLYPNSMLLRLRPKTWLWSSTRPQRCMSTVLCIY